MQRILSVVVVVGLVVVAAQADDWPTFRGPYGNGMSNEKGAPTTWSPTEHIRWKVSLPQPGNSSPVVTGNRVLLTCADDNDGTRRSLYCFNRADGAMLWKKTVEYKETAPTHKTNPYCGSTPATDGQYVVVWHGSAGLYCYDLNGNERWHRDLGEFRHQWGDGASPTLHGDRIYLNCGPGKHVFMGAFDLVKGDELWRVDEPTDGDGEYRGDGKYMGSWSTPVLTRVDGRNQLICSMPTRVVSYDPMSGKVFWYCDGLRSPKGDLAYSSPVIGDGVCLVIGGFNGSAMGFRLGGSGNITETNRLWHSERSPQSIGSGVIVDKYWYVPDAGPGTLRCLDPKTGKTLWTERAGGGNYWGSIVMADGLMYVTNQEGTTIVFRPDPTKFDLVSMNKLDEPSNSTPAISNGQIFIRTMEHLYCIAK